MKNVSSFAAFIAVALAGCAGPQASVGSGDSAPMRSAAYYCAKERLVADGGLLRCNWQPTAEDACRFGNSSAIDRASLASDPQPGGRCNTGDWLVRAVPR